MGSKLACRHRRNILDVLFELSSLQALAQQRALDLAETGLREARLRQRDDQFRPEAPQAEGRVANREAQSMQPSLFLQGKGCCKRDDELLRVRARVACWKGGD